MRNRPYPLYNVPYIPDIRTMIERLAQIAPDEIGFQYTNKKELITKSHKDVLEDTEKLIAFLISKGYHKKNIAIIGANSYEWLITFFAIICSGNIAVAIDAQLPPEKIGQMLTDTDCGVVFVSDKCSDKITLCENRTVFCLNDVLNMKTDRMYDKQSLDPDAPAAIFFTSGTTGNSKGVVLSQKNMMFNVWASRKNFEVYAMNLSVLPFHHTLGLVICLLSTYCYGCPVYINQSFKRLQQDFKLCKPVVIGVVPLFIETFYKMIQHEAQQQNRWTQIQRWLKISNLILSAGFDIRRKIFQKVLAQFGGELRYIICGGAALDISYISFFHSIGIEIINGYGITECSPVVAVTRNHYHRDGSVGSVLTQTQLRFEDDGEILVNNDSVMLGYYKNDEETRRVIKEGWFYTGDVGHIDKDGFLWITGRKNNIIVLSNGENISPEAIEMQLVADNAVEEVVVYSKNNYLAAEIYPESDYQGNEEYFHELINKYNLNQPMCRQISEIRFRNKPFQKNNSGKIIRKGIGES